MKMKILAVYREKIFSNRAVEADRAILDEVLKILRMKFGHQCEITLVHPEEFSLAGMRLDYKLVFSMAQDERVLTYLKLLQSKGAVIVNSSDSIRNCYRHKLSELLSDEVFAYPKYYPVDLSQSIFDDFDESEVWIKRGDFHALVDDDVVFAGSKAEKMTAIDHFRKRGVSKVIFQNHCEGELFKFYGVRDSYFNLRYMGRTGKNRYQFIPGDIDVIFDKTRLEILAHRAARILDLDFFGGDCIVDEKGKMHFIDFNDWPSFRTCVNEVAPVMVNYALKKLQNSVYHSSEVMSADISIQ